MIHNSFKRGFTLVEVAVGVVITIIVTVVAFTGILGIRSSENLTLTTNELSAVIRNVQNRAITQENGSQWGIHFVNTTSSDDYYEIFYGLSYTSGTVVRRIVLRRNIRLINPSTGQTKDIIFAALTGKPASTQTVSFNTSVAQSQARQVQVNAQGLVLISN